MEDESHNLSKETAVYSGNMETDTRCGSPFGIFLTGNFWLECVCCSATHTPWSVHGSGVVLFSVGQMLSASG